MIAIKKIAFLAAIFFSTQVWSVDFARLVQEQKRLKDAVDEHSFCSITESNGDISKEIDIQAINGMHVDKLVKVASISKLFTSYLALYKFGPTYRFQTRFYLDKVSKDLYDLHIAGGWDPYFTYDKFFLLVSELNRLGVTKLRNVTIDSKFRAFLSIRMRDEGDKRTSERLMWETSQERIVDAISTEETISNVSLLFNTDEWSKKLRRMYRSAVADSFRATGVHLRETPTLSVKSVKLSADFDRSGKTPYVMKSPPLITYLKDMNIYSNNYIADRLFNLAGGVEAMQKFLKDSFDFDSRHARLFTGSGLPDMSTGSRRDNVASCRVAITLMEGMSTSLNSYQLSPEDSQALNGVESLRLSDIMMIAGSDVDGTYDGGEGQRGSVVAKTGTLRDQINLAGYARTTKGVVWFGIFLSADSEAAKDAARNFRREVVGAMIDDYGGASRIKGSSGLEFSDFFPYDSKSLLTLEENQKKLN